MFDLKAQFEKLNSREDFCFDDSCQNDENSLKDYPNYTDALYASLIAPKASGIYISRWDLKEIALSAGDNMAIHPRKRMFELLMKYASHRDDMEKVLASLKEHIEAKIEIYHELMESFPASRVIFEPKIAKAQKMIKVFPKILEEYF
jgi:hypothetical protein